MVAAVGPAPCSDGARRTFHVNRSRGTNPNFGLSNPGSQITGHFKIKPIGSASYSQLAAGVSRWIGSKSYGGSTWSTNLTSEEVGILYFGTALEFRLDINAPNDPEMGHVSGWTKVWLAPQANSTVAGHEIGHILGFGDAYTVVGGFGQDVNCHSNDIMNSSGGSVHGYHSQILAEKY